MSLSQRPRKVAGKLLLSSSKESPESHINRQIPPLAHTPMYVWHKYWSRKTWNVVQEHIKTYCPENGIVFDPFAGSGVTALEALKLKRRAIVCDLLPIATEIIHLTIKPANLLKLQESFGRLEKRVKGKILKLYETPCRRCKKPIPFTCAVWDNGECVEIRYDGCPHCGDRREKNCLPVKVDLELLQNIEMRPVKGWYPKGKLYYPDGQPFKEKQKYESLDQLFTKRNLQALAWLMEAIEAEPHRELRDFLKAAFTSMVHLCSRMCPISEAGHFTPFSSAWIQHSYWFAKTSMEQNVWNKFEASVMGHQGILKAKAESNEQWRDAKIAHDVQQVLKGQADAYIHCGDAIQFMGDLRDQFNARMDYIFTDPPYDSAIQFGELAYLWTAWLKKDQGYLERIQSQEIVRNERQHKPFDVYHALLRNAFRGMFDILKPGGYLTVTFHNPTFKVRNATIYAATAAGFEFEHIHHQELARPSAKSLLQPLGSAQGDFYFRFHKPLEMLKARRPEEIDEHRFEKIVVDTTTRVLAERGEPTPYTILINAIDPELAKNGYFSQLHTGLDVQTVLKGHLEKEFTLVPVKLGSDEGQAWWLKDPNLVSRLTSIPLSERVERTVLAKLQQRGRVSFTDMWEAISLEFPNSLTSDSTSIKEALETYARPVSKGQWLLKPGYSEQHFRRAHTRMIAMLAEIGKKQGYEIWIGKREQADSITEAFSGRKGELRAYVDRSSLQGIRRIYNVREVEHIDVLWLKKDNVASAFEVESTTQMTEALKRGSNLEASVPKYMVIPQERDDQLMNKLNSPLFQQAFKKHNWKAIFFEALELAFVREKGRVNVENLASKKIEKQVDKKSLGLQLDLFVRETSEVYG
ncbi:MAG: DNA adenine methylase [Elusimicrobia bacterium]|nr:DNA adenine methylase [Elusimicrobiota bacterium]